jgi:hypothetical protein
MAAETGAVEKDEHRGVGLRCGIAIRGIHEEVVTSGNLSFYRTEINVR